MTLDMEFLQWMKPLLKTLKQRHLPEDPVFDFHLTKANKLFNIALDQLDFRRHGIQCPYQIRHGAASTEVLCRKQPLEQVMKKGRWRTLVSVRRYEQGGRLAQVFGLLSETEQNRCLEAERNSAQLLLRSFGCSVPHLHRFSWNSLQVKGASRKRSRKS